MKRKPNYLKIVLQWVVFLLIAGTVIWAAASKKPVDVEAYCPFGGLQAFGSFIVNSTLACSMSMVQIAMGIVLAVGVILFSKLFCGYLCPLGTVGEWMGRAGRKLHVQFTIPMGSLADKLLRVLKYILLFTVLYFTITSSELFCKHFDPYYAVATGFTGEITLWMSVVALVLLLCGGFFVKMFWCRYICPLGAASNIFKFFWLFVIAALVGWGLSALNVPYAWIWTLAAACLAAYIIEIVKMRSSTFPLLYIERDETTCNKCGLCQKKCPYDIPVYDYKKVKHVDCTLCGSCIGCCAKGSLQVNGRRPLRWLPGIIVIVLFLVALWLGAKTELPTINMKWGDYEQVENMQTFKMEGLQTVKCYGSSMAFKAKMETVQGVHGVKTFVNRHGVEVEYDPAVTDTVQILKAIFRPTIRKYALPAENVPMLTVFHLGVEGLHDAMDMAYFGMALEKIDGIYGFTSEFDCPVKITVYADPAAGIDEERFAKAIDVKELVLKNKVKTAEGVKEIDKTYPMHTDLRSYAVDERQVSREEFAQIMFKDIEKLDGKFIANTKQWGDAAQFPEAVYEIAYPLIDKMLVRNVFPYFKSYLSTTDGILSVDWVLRDTVPVMRIHYVKSMWNDDRIWNEILQAPKWKIRMMDDSFKEIDPRLKFTEQGKTVEETAVK